MAATSEPLVTRSPLRSVAAWARFLGIAAVGVAADLWTKALAVTHLKWQETVKLLPGYLHLDYTENHGAVFGLGQGQKKLFILVSIAAVVFLTFLFAGSGKRRGYQLILGMLMAGVLGNMYDRVVFEYVRDMIHALPGVYWPAAVAHYFPQSWQSDRVAVFPWIFNVADMLLCIGVFLMFVQSFLSPSGTKRRVSADGKVEWVGAQGQTRPTADQTE